MIVLNPRWQRFLANPAWVKFHFVLLFSGFGRSVCFSTPVQNLDFFFLFGYICLPCKDAAVFRKPLQDQSILVLTYLLCDHPVKYGPGWAFFIGSKVVR